MRKTKIVATLGPASNTPEIIIQLLQAGMDVARLNFSHGTHEEHAKRISMLRQAAQQVGKPLAILLDLQGPKIRTGNLENGGPVHLIPGQRFDITTHETIGTPLRVSTTYTELPHDVQPGDRILLSDGLIELRVIDTTADEVRTEVVFGGALREHQGINLPGVRVSAPSMTEKDVEDLEFGLAQDIDYVALSFVRRADDIYHIKDRIAAAGKSLPVVAKIEKPEALNELADILDATDAIMVARGDLGVEMPAERVPLVQKQLIEAANNAGVPVITATQMLESMIHNPRPTRAEASDVANAILDGTDAVMLSGETAAGEFPVESVRTMADIAMAVETSERYIMHNGGSDEWLIEHQRDVANAISAAARAIVEALSVKAIVAFTMSGNTARLMARTRPKVPIFAFTPSEAVYRQLALVWGVRPMMCEYKDRLENLTDQVQHDLLAYGLADPDDMVVITGGHPMSARGATNFVKVLSLSDNY
ncbi:MAG TPA: pyruvate kinase [Roseiflexaceae bacterium]|jgi:pyruvate kinase|nr:pyruvate kinase [Roseiflexaceae bacterium]